MSVDFLLEIGTEEIPHWMIPAALDQLSKMNLFGATPQVDATPRRLVVRASGLPERTPDTEDVLLGPAPGPGFSIGMPMDRATEGFIKKHKLAITDIYLQVMPDGKQRWAVTRKLPGRPVRDLLAESLGATILSIQWPKTMYWTKATDQELGPAPSPGFRAGKPMDEATQAQASGPNVKDVYIDDTGRGLRWVVTKQVRFIRPIRWIVALLGDQVVPFELAGVKSGSVTRGHRKLGSSSIPVTTANYESELRKNFVILSSEERRRKIQTEVAALGAKFDHELLETLTFITEYPTAIKGGFDPAYLELPAEVLTMVMRHHQKYFSVEKSPGELAPYFVAVMNTSGDPEGLVQKGNERVLKARFNDARFFWKADLQRTLYDRVQDLDRVTFQAKLGSYLFKTERVKALVEDLGGDSNAQSAAYLAKADLTTEMVKEFTDLQGIMGGLYAKTQGEPEAVWRAVYEHYKPLSMEDSIPSTPEGQLVALADKLDTLQQCFRIGLAPTGSKDPFALRRAAQGVVRILVEAKLDHELNDLAEGDLREFLLDRIKYYFREIRGFKYDEVNAVLASGCGTLSDLEARLIALAAVRPTENFEPLAASFKRIQNILKQASHAEGQPIAEADFQQDAEKQLFRELGRVVETVKNTQEYRPILETIASTRPSIDKFFDQVMVMDENIELRSRRLELLQRISKQFQTIADFSEIVTSGDQK